jgi:hypothetical protein
MFRFILFACFLIALGGLFLGCRKPLNYWYYQKFVKTNDMDTTPYIVQYVGFETRLDSTAFLQRWMPFANQFKAAGILTIDLYAVRSGEGLAFMSRNVWPAEVYFRNFPGGMAGSAGGGGVQVRQLGGYWLEETQLEKEAAMQLVFLPEAVGVDTVTVVSRQPCTARVPYRQLLDLPVQHPGVGAGTTFLCNHLKSM